jgi:hypothetical protein
MGEKNYKETEGLKDKLITIVKKRKRLFFLNAKQLVHITYYTPTKHYLKSHAKVWLFVFNENPDI